jgi:hypothetical protein
MQTVKSPRQLGKAFISFSFACLCLESNQYLSTPTSERNECSLAKEENLHKAQRKRVNVRRCIKAGFIMHKQRLKPPEPGRLKTPKMKLKRKQSKARPVINNEDS